MLNKFLIPAALVATVVIAGIFAFMPVEKASTVHGTLATTTSQTTNTGTITTNTDAELDALDRTVFLSMNMSRDGKGIFTVIPAKAGKTISGSYILSVTANNHTSSYQGTSPGSGHGFGVTEFSCGLVDGQGNILSATNASKTDTTSPNISANGTLAPDAGRAVAVQYDRTNSNVGGVCNVYLFLDSNAGE